MSENYDFIAIGAGAAGFFAAINAARVHPPARVLILEKNRQVLAKVKISGGGRCNVTHRCFDPNELVRFYPRGGRELVGPFHRFQPKDTIEWFKRQGVELKEEEDGRIFPVSDSSQTIIDALESARKEARVELKTEVKIASITKEEGLFKIETEEGSFFTPKLLLATGSSPQGHAFARQFGHTLAELAPSLFSFNIPGSPLLDLSGISVTEAEVSIEGTGLKQKGALLLTHWGFSGPAILKLSAFGARILQAMQYQAALLIDWAPSLKSVKERIDELKKSTPAKSVQLTDFAPLPRNLAERLLTLNCTYAHLKRSDSDRIEEVLKRSRYAISGKTTYKQEFVTCGGISLKEVDFRTMESKICKGLYFAGEILDVDGVTGGFNFQNAWTTAWIASHAAFAEEKSDE